MSDKPGQEKIIDAEAEPLAKPSAGRFLRIVLYVLAAVVLSVAIAVGYDFATSGKLDALIGSRTVSTPAPRPVVPAPAPAVQAPPPSVVPMSPRDARLDELENRLAALTASLERLQQLPSANAVDPHKIADLEQQ